MQNQLVTFAGLLLVGLSHGYWKAGRVSRRFLLFGVFTGLCIVAGASARIFAPESQWLEIALDVVKLTGILGLLMEFRKLRQVAH